MGATNSAHAAGGVLWSRFDGEGDEVGIRDLIFVGPVE
jgi:hypothetical protein